MKSIFKILPVLLLLSCTNNKVKSYKTTLAYSAKNKDTGKHQIFPMGAEKLSCFFKKVTIRSHKKETDTDLQKSFSKICTTYHNLTLVKSIDPPSILTIVSVAIDKNVPECGNDKYFKKDFKYHLTDLGNYQVYYQTGDFLEGRSLPENKNDPLHDCVEYGNVLLCDKKKHIAKVLNVYFNYNDQAGSHYRFFSIVNPHTIYIYEFSDLETGVQAERTRAVHINKNGQVSITIFK